MTSHRLRLVIPCFNEARRLPVDALADWVRDTPASTHARALTLVDDGSSDATLDVLHALAARAPDRIRVLALPRNAGKAEAVRHGLRDALRDAPHDASTLVGYWDADLATPLDEVDPMIRAFERHPRPLVVMGSRVQLLGRRIDRNPLRHYLGRVFATAASLVLDVPVYDTQCGAKLLRPHPILDDALARPFVSGWVFDVELLARLADLAPRHDLPTLDALVVEHPLARWTDVAGSKVRPSDFPRALVQLARVATRDRTPPSLPPAR